MTAASLLLRVLTQHPGSTESSHADTFDGDRSSKVTLSGLVLRLRSSHLNPGINKRGAQLLFTSQDVSTMRNDVFRRDEIRFAAKGEGEASLRWSPADIGTSGGAKNSFGK